MSVVIDASVIVVVADEVAAITARLRRRHATDSTYVSLAYRLRTVVWTLDGALARNAADLGLPVRLVA